MAKKSRARTTSGRSGASEVNKTLVAFLVFFILTSIGAGVGAYYGFAEQEQDKAKVTEAERNKKIADEERDFYKFAYLYSRTYFGVARAEDDDAIAAGLDKYLGDNGRVGEVYPSDKGGEKITELGGYVKRLNEYAEMDKSSYRPKQPPILTDLDNMAAPAAKRQPVAVYDVFTVRDEMEKIIKNVIRQRDQEKAAKDARIAAITQEKDTFKKQITDSHDKLKADADKVVKILEKIYTADAAGVVKVASDDFVKDLAEQIRKKIEMQKEKTFADLTKEAMLAKDVEVRREQLRKALDAKQLEVNDLVKQLREVEAQVQRQRVEVVDKPLFAVARIIEMSASQDQAYVSLSARDGLKKGVTFSVFEKGPGDKPIGVSKGTVEVIEVKTSYSIVAITSRFDPSGEADYLGRRVTVGKLAAANTDPIKVGDVLVNPTWDPNRKTYVAIAGMVDLRGDGFNQIESFVRSLESQNIVVDVYQDPRNGSYKGRGASSEPEKLKSTKGLTSRTSLLILGKSPASGELGAPRNAGRAAEIQTKMSDLQNASKAAGIRVVQLRRFLDEIGYPQPRVISATDKLRGVER